MSALLVDDLLAYEQYEDGSRRTVTSPRPYALVTVPRAVSPARPATASRGPGGVRLTDRGIAVILAIFALLMVTSVVVVVTSFLAIPNDPIGGVAAVAEAAMTAP